MTLKDKFVGADRYSIKKTTLADRCEQIADDFAIEFLDSIREYERENGSRICFDERDSKELLQIFKKEKCL
jgi:hypothetical protein